MPKRINIKKSILLIKLLIEEKEECEDICNDAKREFEESIMQAHHDYNVHDTALDTPYHDQPVKKASKTEDNDGESVDNSEQQADQSSKKSHPDWIKKLYRKIAIATHPDKMQKNASDKIKAKLLEMYTKSKIALESYDYMTVVILASDIDIDIPEKDVAGSGIIDTKHKSLASDISSLKQSVYWQWAHSTSEQKENILKDFAKSRGWMSKENHRKKSRKGKGRHPGKSIAQMKKEPMLKKKV